MNEDGAVPEVKVEGLEPTFRHIDDPDIPWQQVKVIRNADGTTSSVWEKWLAFSPDPQYLSLYARWDPGMVIRRHGHFSPHVIFVISGDMWCGERRCPAGTHVELPLGAAFGPFVAGPEGTVLLEVMMGDPRSWGTTRTRSMPPCTNVVPKPSPIRRSTFRPGSKTSGRTGRPMIIKPEATDPDWADPGAVG